MIRDWNIERPDSDYPDYKRRMVDIWDDDLEDLEDIEEEDFDELIEEDLDLLDELEEVDNDEVHVNRWQLP